MFGLKPKKKPGLGYATRGMNGICIKQQLGAMWAATKPFKWYDWLQLPSYIGLCLFDELTGGKFDLSGKFCETTRWFFMKFNYKALWPAHWIYEEDFKKWAKTADPTVARYIQMKHDKVVSIYQRKVESWKFPLKNFNWFEEHTSKKFIKKVLEKRKKYEEDRLANFGY